MDTNKQEKIARGEGARKKMTRAQKEKAKAIEEAKANDPRRTTKSPINDKTTGIAIWRMYLDYVDAEGSTGKGTSLKIHMISLEGFNDYINSSGKWMYNEKYTKTLEKIERHMRARFFKYASSGQFTASFTKLYYDMYLNEEEDTTEVGTMINIIDNRSIKQNDSNASTFEKKEPFKTTPADFEEEDADVIYEE